MPGNSRPAVAAAVMTKARIALVNEAMRTVPAGASRSALQVLLGGADALEDRAGVGGERDPGVGQRDRPAVALEQRRAALALEHGQLL